MASSAPFTVEQATAAGFLPASHWQKQALEDEGIDNSNDEELTRPARLGTASLTPTVYDYRAYYGRTYHGEVGNAEAWEPNDKQHVEAMEIFHHAMMVQLDGKLYLSPLDKKKVRRVLDVGTGNGMWAIDFADQFPDAEEIIGTDVSPIQPDWVPPNVKFEIDDCNLEWTWEPNSFDFTHMRMLSGVIDDWNKLFRNAYRCCKPGGWVESMGTNAEFLSDNGSIKPGSALHQWGKVFKEGGRKLGRPFSIYEDDLQRKGMEAAGFVDIQIKDIQCPMGVWHPDPKAHERGLWYKMAIEEDLEGYLNYIFHVVLGWIPEETKAFATQAKKEWNNPDIHGYFILRVVYGRKPEPGERKSAERPRTKIQISDLLS
ncbi:S-adenosyl-L-methionine-dependent methyltransferase [Sordaria brevicollis]|uniref:S-adenosyl-L-methionine-dependent methyltransferase n=1 Tax=Sordaria brevicollis TaxID=83679 RepID=A0AAE0PGV7_SORBR|nr:S-adenosyl-L-methionine-dependent methyltransferase [Sordaria brevicollis]